MQNGFNSRLARHLRVTRRAHDLTLEGLAERTGISRASLSRIETGEVSPSADALDRIARAYDLSVSRLVVQAEAGFAAYIPERDQIVRTEPDIAVVTRETSAAAPGLRSRVMEYTLPVTCTFALVPDTGLGEEHIVLLHEGGIDVAVDGALHSLAPGDALRCIPDGIVTVTTGQDAGARMTVFSSRA